jgi:DNA-binding SARP family transcriptional activator
LTAVIVGRGLWGYLGVAVGDRTCIQLCGALTVEIAGRRVEAELPGRQGRLLLTYLTLHRMRPVSRDEVIEALWPDDRPAAPDAGLSALLSKLRRALAPAGIHGTEAIRLELPPGARVDVEQAAEAIHRAESALAAGEPRRAAGPCDTARYISERGFLPGCSAPWIDEQRRELEDIMLRSLECTVSLSLQIGGAEGPAAARAARRLVALAPYRESGCVRLMEVLEAEGNVAEAMRVYDQMRCRLRDDLGTAPSAALQAVHLRLLRSDAAAV